MNDTIDYTNNPLHGVGLKRLLIELVEHYGFELLFAYLNINCFKTNPSIASSVKFLKKTTWAREKVEDFYLYQFKNLPRASAEQFALSPRDRIIPDEQTPGEPAVLSLEDAERLREKRVKRSATGGPGAGPRSGADKRRDSKRTGQAAERSSKSRSSSPTAPSTSTEGTIDPWAKWRK
ncbi:MAG: VF530 family DNA-binding protein [Sedimenticola sp.]|nr:VF530 family DNA-binding protein [Sedimenticola sp.]